MDWSDTSNSTTSRLSHITNFTSPNIRSNLARRTSTTFILSQRIQLSLCPFVAPVIAGLCVTVRCQPVLPLRDLETVVPATGHSLLLRPKSATTNKRIHAFLLKILGVATGQEGEGSRRRAGAAQPYEGNKGSRGRNTFRIDI